MSSGFPGLCVGDSSEGRLPSSFPEAKRLM
jgi:hypothetical protein